MTSTGNEPVKGQSSPTPEAAVQGPSVAHDDATNSTTVVHGNTYEGTKDTNGDITFRF